MEGFLLFSIKFIRIKLMNSSPYLFVIFIWGVYLLNSLYLNYKMRRFFLQKKIEEVFLIPIYFFIFVLLIKASFYYLYGVQITSKSPTLNGFFSPLLGVVGMLFCLSAIFLFIYVTYFESFPSCLFIQHGKNLSGIYNYIRHPSYIVFFLITFGTAFYLNDIFLFILACINHISLYFFYMIEEKRFIKRFPYHREYIKKTRMFLPTFSKKP